MRNHTKRRALLPITLALLGIAAFFLAPAPVASAQPSQRDRNGMPPVPPGGPGRVGARVERLRLTLPVDPVVVIVPDGDAYIDAIARWSVDHRYPVLIDDGTPGARENIARFIRAFAPEKALAWPGTRKGEGSQRERIEGALYKAWGADSFEGMRTIWNNMDIEPPGVVVTSEGDTAWPAALALAAGRGQPLLWVSGRHGSLGGIGKNESFQAFEKQIRGQLDGLRYTWRSIGDDLDAITVCMNMPSRYWSADAEPDALALTDMLGRFQNGEVYAWAGLIIGSEAESAYRAMGALFLQPEEFWLFNGYPTEPPYDGYTVYPVENALRRMGRTPITHNPPRNSVDDWRAATAKPIDAGYVHVNSSGHREWFDLNPGKAYTSDIPVLEKPAVVTFIHSFSAQKLDDRDSIARRWLDNGAYAYVGAMDEPFLQGFTPPSFILPGLFMPVPLGVMCRPNSPKPWKINTIGDPLITLGPTAGRTDRIPTLPGAKDIEVSMKEALTNRDYARAIREFVMLGRNADVGALGKALFAQDVSALTPEVCEPLFHVFYATGRPDLLTKCYLKMPQDQREDTVNIDIMWKAVGGDLDTTRNEEMLDAMVNNVRDATFLEDITAVSNAIRRLRGDAAALAFLSRHEREPGLSDDRRRYIGRLIERIDPRGN